MRCEIGEKDVDDDLHDPLGKILSCCGKMSHTYITRAGLQYAKIDDTKIHVRSRSGSAEVF